MKYITKVEELSVDELCEKVKEDEEYRKRHPESELGFMYLNLNDLESDSEIIRCIGIFEKEKDRDAIGWFEAKKMSKSFNMTEWIPIESLSYDSKAGLRWNK